MQENMAGKSGITLVSLVVTVIVLMILAGITLTLVLGQNGLIQKAQQAKEVSTNADKETAEGLNSLYNEMITQTENQPESQISMTVATAIGKKLSDTDNIELKDDEGNIVTIPAGFHVASDSKTKQEDGIVIEDQECNQFVWIPVTSISNYQRIDFGKGLSFSSCLETMPSDEQASISTYHGYYIGRYEAGDSVSTANKTLRASGASLTNKVSIKKGQAPYNYITEDQAKTLAEGMKTAEKYKATTKLCSSYAWDTAINFIQEKVPDYGTNSPQGNYPNTTFNYIDITGVTQNKAIDSNILIPTGQTEPMSNIYDMGGNIWEYTTEMSGVYHIIRGCNGCYVDGPAGSRDYVGSTFVYVKVGMRIALFM